MNWKTRHHAYIIMTMLISSFLVYIPFLNQFKILARFYDGPLYAIVAKSLYRIQNLQQATSLINVDGKYFACHLPLYPLLIKIVSPLTAFNVSYAIFPATLLASILCVIAFYELLTLYSAVTSPLFTSLLFCFFPARWLIYHSLGASEPLFLFFVFMTFILYKKGYFWGVALAITCASLTRIVGVLLGPAFFILYLRDKQFKKAFILPISGIGILLLFTYYKLQFNDFFAYFSKNLVQFKLIQWPPLIVYFSQLNDAHFWNAEYLLALLGMHLVGLFLCFEKKEFFIFGLIYFIFFLFINHIDLSRYLLPISWICLLIGFDPILSKKPTKIALIILIPFFYFYVWNFIPLNTMGEKTYEQLLLNYFSK